MNRKIAFMDRAKTALEKDYDRFCDLVEKVQGTDIGDFVNRVLDWQLNHPDFMYELFREVIDTSDMNFMGSFNQWVRNALLDDDDFLLVFEVFDDKTGNLVPMPSDYCKKGFIYPKIVPGFGKGTSNVAVLMEAMDQVENNRKLSYVLEEKKLKLLEKLRQMT